MNEYVIEPAAREFADAAAQPLLAYELSPSAARRTLEDIQVGQRENVSALPKKPCGSVAEGRAATLQRRQRVTRLGPPTVLSPRFGALPTC
jgi:hypothetical protein